MDPRAGSGVPAGPVAGEGASGQRRARAALLATLLILLAGGGVAAGVMIGGTRDSGALVG